MSIISKLLPTLRISKTVEFVPLVPFALQTKFTNSRCYSTEKKHSLAKSQDRSDVSTDVRPLGEKIKETTKTVSYTGIILLGVGVTGVIFFYVFRELFSSNSANSIYSVALEKCKNDPRVEDALGAPIKGYGEETTRRRRTHVSHAVYVKDGVKYMRMRFYIKGIRNKAVVELDMKQRKTVILWVRRYQDEGSLLHRQRSGRPPRLIHTPQLHVSQGEYEENEFEPIIDYAGLFKISVDTVHRALQTLANGTSLNGKSF